MCCSVLVLLMGNLSGQPASEVPEKPTDIAPLLIGEKAPSASLRSVDDTETPLQEILKLKPTVLIFYRGGWCPYCNLQLSELQAIEAGILKLGYQIVAVSPDSPERIKSSIDKHELNYRIFSDSQMRMAKEFGLAYKAPKRNLKGLSKSSAGKNPGWLPVPAVFVLNTEGIILFEYINPDYSTRLPGGLLLAALKELKQGN